MAEDNDATPQLQMLYRTDLPLTESTDTTPSQPPTAKRSRVDIPLPQSPDASHPNAPQAKRARIGLPQPTSPDADFVDLVEEDIGKETRAMGGSDVSIGSHATAAGTGAPVLPAPRRILKPTLPKWLTGKCELNLSLDVDPTAFVVKGLIVSNEVELAGVKWFLRVKRIQDPADKKDVTVQACLVGKIDQSAWRAQCKILLTLENPDKSHFNQAFECEIYRGKSTKGMSLKWDYFISGGVFKAHLLITRVNGEFLSFPNFDDPKVTGSDELIVEGKYTLYVNKELLSGQSDVLALFFSENPTGPYVFPKQNRVNDVICTLRTMYPQMGEINDRNVRAITSLSHQLQIFRTQIACEAYLMSTDCKYSLLDKLDLATQFPMRKLQNQCKAQLTSFEVLEEQMAKQEERGANLHQKTRAELYELLFEWSRDARKRHAEELAKATAINTTLQKDLASAQETAVLVEHVQAAAKQYQDEAENSKEECCELKDRVRQLNETVRKLQNRVKELTTNVRHAVVNMEQPTTNGSGRAEEDFPPIPADLEKSNTDEPMIASPDEQIRLDDGDVNHERKALPFYDDDEEEEEDEEHDIEIESEMRVEEEEDDEDEEEETEDKKEGDEEEEGEEEEDDDEEGEGEEEDEEEEEEEDGQIPIIHCLDDDDDDAVMEIVPEENGQE